MKTNDHLLRRLAGALARQLQLAAALGSWAYRAPYPWEFELVNARWPRPDGDAPPTRASAAAPASPTAGRFSDSAGCGCAVGA